MIELAEMLEDVRRSLAIPQWNHIFQGRPEMEAAAPSGHGQFGKISDFSGPVGIEQAWSLVGMNGRHDIWIFSTLSACHSFSTSA